MQNQNPPKTTSNWIYNPNTTVPGAYPRYPSKSDLIKMLNEATFKAGDPRIQLNIEMFVLGMHLRFNEEHQKILGIIQQGYERSIVELCGEKERLKSENVSYKAELDRSICRINALNAEIQELKDKIKRKERKKQRKLMEFPEVSKSVSLPRSQA